MYTQLVLPNYNIPYVGGLCEGYVEGTVGQATLPTPQNPTTYGVYPTAAAAWASSPNKHPGELPPKGLTVAVHFTLGNNKAGHVAMSLPDGRVASSSKAGYNSSPVIYPNLNAMIADYAKYNNGCGYLGWDEWIGKKQVVKKGEEMSTSDLSVERILAYFVGGRNGYDGTVNALNGECDDELKKNHVGTETNKSVSLWYSSQECKNWYQVRLPAMAKNNPEGYIKILEAGQAMFIKETK